MCTMTWWRADGSRYGVLFNRDEKKVRSRALAPTVETVEGTRCILPRDPEGGGTWLLCNEHGLTFAILNAYQVKEFAGPAPRSRGLIPLSLAAARNLSEVEDLVSSLDAKLFRPFTLVALDCEREMAWTTTPGGELDVASEIDQPLVSSSFRADEVLPARRQIYQRLFSGRTRSFTCGRHELSRFHHWCEGGATAVTPLMNRPDAQTVSICEFEFSPERCTCRYEALPVDLEGELEETDCSLVF